MKCMWSKNGKFKKFGSKEKKKALKYQTPQEEMGDVDMKDMNDNADVGIEVADDDVGASIGDVDENEESGREVDVGSERE